MKSPWFASASAPSPSISQPPSTLDTFIVQDGTPALMAPTASLAVLIYNFSGMPFENQIEMAWAAALVLVLLVLAINILGQIFSRRRV